MAAAGRPGRPRTAGRFNTREELEQKVATMRLHGMPMIHIAKELKLNRRTIKQIVCDLSLGAGWAKGGPFNR